MERDWSKISSDPDFQALSADEQGTVRQKFYDTVVAPDPDFKSLPPDDQEHVRGRIFGATPPPAAGSPAVKTAGEILSAPGRYAKALGVGLEDLATNTTPAPMPHEGMGETGLPPMPASTAEKMDRAVQPGYQPRPGEKLGAWGGSLLAAVPETMAAGAAFDVVAPMVGLGMGAEGLSTIGRMALARAQREGVAWGAQAGLAATSEYAALTGKVDPLLSAKATAGGAVTGALAGAAGSLSALASGRFPEWVTKAMSDQIAARMVGAGAAGVIGAGSSAAQGGSKEDDLSNAAAFFVMDFLGNADFDARWREAAKGSLIKPAVDALVGSGLSPEQAIGEARAGLETELAAAGKATAAVKATPEYEEAVKFMAGKYLASDPSLVEMALRDPKTASELAEAQARRRLDLGFAHGEVTVAELNKMKFEMAAAGPETPEEAPPPPPGAMVVPAPESGPGEPPGPPPVAPQPQPGDLVTWQGPGGAAEGHVTGYHPETGEPMIQVTGASGAEPPAEPGALAAAPPHELSPVDSWDVGDEPAGEAPVDSKLIRGPARSIGELTPDEFKTRFKGVPETIYVKALEQQIDAGRSVPAEALDKYPELAEQAKEAGIRASEKQLEAEGLGLRSTPVMDFIRASGGIDLESLKADKQMAGYGELRTQDLLKYGIARRGGFFKSLDHAAEAAQEAPGPHGRALIPERTPDALLEAFMSEARKHAWGMRVGEPSFEDRYPSEFTGRATPPAPEEWRPERLKAALDQAQLKPGGEVVSAGFNDPDHGRIKRGATGKLLSVDLEHGRLLVQFDKGVAIVDPRDITQTLMADRQVAQMAPKPPPRGAVKKGVELATGIKADEPTIALAQSELLNLTLLHQQKGSLRAEAVTRRAMVAKMHEVLRGGKDVRRTLALLIREAAAGLKLNSTEVGRLVGLVASAQTDTHFMYAVTVAEEVFDKAYGKQLQGEIEKVYERAADAPGVEAGWRQRVEEVFNDISFTKLSDAKAERVAAAMEFVAQADATGHAAEVPPDVRRLAEMGDKKPLGTLSIERKEEILDTLLALERAGRQAQKFKEFSWEFRVQRRAAEFIKDVRPFENRPPSKSVDKPGTLQDQIRAENATKVEDAQQKGRSVLFPLAFLDMADGNQGYQGAHARWIGRALGTDARDSLQHGDQILDPVRATINRLKITPEEFESVAAKLISQQYGGMKHIRGDSYWGVTPDAREAKVRGIVLDERQKQLANSLLKAGNDEQVFKAIATTARRLDNVEVVKVPGYYPFRVANVGWADEPIDQQIYSSYVDGYKEAYAAKRVDAGFTIERTDSDAPLRYDLQSFERSIYAQMWYIHCAESIRLNAEAVNRDHYKRAAGKGVTTMTRDYLSLLARRGGAKQGQRLDWLRALTRNISTYKLGFRVFSAFAHIGLVPMSMQRIGVGNVIWGMSRTGGARMKFMIDNMAELRHSLRGMQALEGLRDTSVAFGVFDSARRLAAGGVALGAYRGWFLNRGLKPDFEKANPAAIAYAAEAMKLDQGSPMFYDLPLALSAGGLSGNVNLDRAWGQFHLPAFTMTNYFKHEFYDLSLAKGEVGDATKKLLALTASLMIAFGIKQAGRRVYASILGAVFGAANPADDESIWKKFAIDTASQIPFVSNLMAMAPIDRHGHLAMPRTGVPAVDIVTDAVRGAVGAGLAAHAGNNAAALHATVEALGDLVAMRTGLPGGAFVEQAAQSAVSAAVPSGSGRPIRHTDRPTRHR